MSQQQSTESQKPSLLVLFHGIDPSQSSTTTTTPSSYSLNFNKLASGNLPTQNPSEYPLLKASCAYGTTILVTLKLPSDMASRQFLQYPLRPQYFLSTIISPQSENFFIYDVKASETDVDRYYVSVGVSMRDLRQNQQPDTLHTTDNLENTQDIRACAQTESVTGTILFQINDDHQTEVILNMEASFMDAKSYEKMYSRRDAIQRGLTLSGNRVKLLRARPMLNEGCECVWERGLPYVVSNDEQDEQWTFNLLFPSTAKIDEALHEESDDCKRSRAKQRLNSHRSSRTPSEYFESEDGVITQHSLNDSLRRRQQSTDDDKQDMEDDWDAESEIHSSHQQVHVDDQTNHIDDESRHLQIDQHTLRYIAGSCDAHNRWMQRFHKAEGEEPCDSPKNIQEFLAQNSDLSSFDTRKKD